MRTLVPAFSSASAEQRAAASTASYAMEAFNPPARYRVAHYANGSGGSGAPHPSTAWFGSRFLGAAGRIADLSGKAHPPARSLRTRRPRRYRRPARRCQADRSLGPAGGGGEPAGRQRFHRHDGGGEKRARRLYAGDGDDRRSRSEEHTSELQSHSDLVCRLLLEKKKKQKT